jgi:predicted TIM-barrel fold metal-dependent hydrolase
MAAAAPRQLIDWHSHCWLPEHFTADQAAEMQDKVGALAAPPDRHRAAMAGVDRYVIVGVQWGLPHGPNVPNDFVAEQVAASGGRAVGFASVNPSQPDAPAELERAVRTLGLRGLKLSPAYQGFDPRLPEAWRLYELADRWGVPVMFHAGGAYPASAALETANPVLLDPVARAFPELPIIVAHLGQPWMAETVMLLRKHRRVFADLSARFHRPWQLYNGLVLALEYRVEDKLLFGTDFPVATPEQAMAQFRGLNRLVEGTNLPRIPEDVIEGILYERPLALVGLD